MNFKSAHKEDGGERNNGLLSNSGMEWCFARLAELRNTSLHREFPARINLSLFLSFAEI